VRLIDVKRIDGLLLKSRAKSLANGLIQRHGVELIGKNVFFNYEYLNPCIIES